ncbi:MAG TPA: hypothetical protein VFN10_05240 [Thermoanaerobaculia bacterium]|nr:hypothetical protein [Thermoanaerobaculia bacterium]
MKFVAAVLFCLSVSCAAHAAVHDWVLASDGALVGVDVADDGTSISLVTRRTEGMAATLIPAAANRERQSDARLLLDATTGTLFVIWNRDGAIVAVSRAADGTWAPELTLARSAPGRHGLVATLTRSAGTEFVHAAWWDGDDRATARAAYALAAYENGAVTSAWSGSLDELERTSDVAAVDAAGRLPLLAFSPSEREEVDLYHGASDGEGIVRVKVLPKLQAEGRIWVPLPRQTSRIERPLLENINDASLRILTSTDRLAIYTRAGDRIRYSTYDGETWSAEHVVILDSEISADAVVRELQRMLASDVHNAPRPSAN